MHNQQAHPVRHSQALSHRWMQNSLTQPTQAVSRRGLAVRRRGRRQGSWVTWRQTAFPFLQALPLSSVLALKTELTAPTGLTSDIAVPVPRHLIYRSVNHCENSSSCILASFQ